MHAALALWLPQLVVLLFVVPPAIPAWQTLSPFANLYFTKKQWIYCTAWNYLQLPLWQWGVGNVSLLVLSSWNVYIADNPIAVVGPIVDMFRHRRCCITLPIFNMLVVQSNLPRRNFLVTLKLFLNAKCSLFIWSKWQIGHGKWFLNTNKFLIKTFLITKFDCIFIWIADSNRILRYFHNKF